MAPQKPTRPKPGRKAAPEPPQYRQHPPRPPAGPPEVVDPIWLLKAIVIVITAALVCGYVSLCFLLYQGQWQLILHPQRTSVVPAFLAGTPIELLRFGTDESGTPQLTGWAIPAEPGARYAAITMLFLPPGDGSLLDSLPTLTLLHHLGVNLFAIDYRGYGQSVAVHPNQQRMMQDADWAFQYLSASRAIPERQIVPYGAGVGASLAVHLAATHPAVPAIIVDTPGPDPLETVLHDPRTRFLPVRALLHDRFPLAEPLLSLKTPKLLIQPEKNDQALRTAANPKITVFDLPDRSSAQFQPMMTGALTRFLDQYVTTGTPQLLQPSIPAR